MCGRYAASRDAINKAFDAASMTIDAGVDFDFNGRYNVPPTAMMPIIRMVDGGRDIAMARWKLVPFWSKTRETEYNTINAKAETVKKAASYRDPFKKRRCLVPASGFFEWREENGGKQPYFFTVRGRPLAFAGLWDEWKPQKGEDGEPLLSFTIVVGEANPLVSDIHKRMPIIFDPSDWDRWLDPAVVDPSDLLKPYPHNLMNVWPVSKAVNKVSSQGPELIEPIGVEVALAA